MLKPNELTYFTRLTLREMLSTRRIFPRRPLRASTHYRAKFGSR